MMTCPILHVLCPSNVMCFIHKAICTDRWCLVISFIRWRSIRMRAGPAFLQFDWSKAGLSMDLPVFVYSHTKTSFRFLSRQRKYREAFYVVTDLLLQATQREPYRALVLSSFVCQGLLITKIVICIHYLIVSSPHAVRPTTMSFA